MCLPPSPLSTSAGSRAAQPSRPHIAPSPGPPVHGYQAASQAQSDLPHPPCALCPRVQPDTETGWPRTPAGSQYLLLHGRGAWAGLRLDGLLLLHRLLLELQQLLDVHGLGHDGLPCGQHAAGETRVRVRARIPFPRLPASPSHSDRQLSTKTAP